MPSPQPLPPQEQTEKAQKLRGRGTSKNMRAFAPDPPRSSSRSLGKEQVLRDQLLQTLGPPLSPKSQEVADATAAANKKKAEDQSRNKNAKAEHAEYTTIEEEMDQRQRDKERLEKLTGEAIAALAALRNAGGKLDIIKKSEVKRIVESSKTQKSRSPRRKSKDRRRRR